MTTPIKKPRPPQRPSRAAIARHLVACAFDMTRDPDLTTRLLNAAMKADDPLAFVEKKLGRRPLQVEPPPAAAPPPRPDPAPANPTPPREPAARPASGCVTIDVPLAEPRGGYLSRLVDFKLTPEHAQAAARLVAGLKRSNAELKSGRRVEGLADGFRWLLEQIE